MPNYNRTVFVNLKSEVFHIKNDFLQIPTVHYNPALVIISLLYK